MNRSGAHLSGLIFSLGLLLAICGVSRGSSPSLDRPWDISVHADLGLAFRFGGTAAKGGFGAGLLYRLGRSRHAIGGDISILGLGTHTGPIYSSATGQTYRGKVRYRVVPVTVHYSVFSSFGKDAFSYLSGGAGFFTFSARNASRYDYLGVPKANDSSMPGLVGGVGSVYPFKGRDTAAGLDARVHYVTGRDHMWFMTVMGRMWF